MQQSSAVFPLAQPSVHAWTAVSLFQFITVGKSPSTSELLWAIGEEKISFNALPLPTPFSFPAESLSTFHPSLLAHADGQAFSGHPLGSKNSCFGSPLVPCLRKITCQ